MPTPPRVIVVLDRDYGDRLLDLSRDQPAWIRSSPANESATRAVWREAGDTISAAPWTLFVARNSGESAADAFLGELDIIDLHHGPLSSPAPYLELEVIGTPPTNEVLRELADRGFSLVETGAYRFIVRKREVGEAE